MPVRRFTALFALAMLASPLAAHSAAPYAITARIPAPDGGWDYASIGPGPILYIARATTVTALPLPPGAPTSFGTIARGHAVIPIPAEHLLLVTSGDDGTTRLIDPATGSQRASIQTGADPDGAAYDPEHNLAYVVEGDPGRIAIIDPHTATLRATIDIAPGLEFPAIAQGRLYINNTRRAELDSMDLATHAARPPIALPNCQHPTGLAYDRPANRLISACASGEAVIVDPATDRIVSTSKIGGGADAVIIDPVRRRAFIPCGRAALLEIFALDAPGIPLIQHLQTEPGARTGALNPRDGTLYLPTAKRLPPAAPGARPTPIPGSFHILVIEPGARP